MIQVTIYTNPQQYCVGFTAKGHADYGGETGTDIVCASVSMLIINTLNAIEKYTGDTCQVQSDEASGDITCQFDELPSKDANLLLQTMILGLEDLAHDTDYAAYIKVTYKEVLSP